MTVLVILVISCLFVQAAAQCNVETFEACVETADAEFLFDLDGLSNGCSENNTKEGIEALVAKVSTEESTNCIDAHLGGCKDDYELDTLHAEMTFKLHHVAQTISDECDLAAGPFCAGKVMGCIFKNVRMEKYIEMNDTQSNDDMENGEDDDNSTMPEDYNKEPKHIIEMLLASKVTEQEGFDDLCGARAEDDKSNLRAALQCIDAIAAPCDVDLKDYISNVDTYHEMLGLVFQEQYFACSDGCKNPDLPKRLANLEACRTETILAMTVDSVNQALENATAKTEYCTAAATFTTCIEEKSKGCAYITRLAVETWDSDDDEIIKALEVLLTAENCPNAKLFTEFKKTINSYDDDASNITGAGVALTYTFVMTLVTLLIALTM